MHGEGLLRYSNGHLDEDLAVPDKSLGWDLERQGNETR